MLKVMTLRRSSADLLARVFSRVETKWKRG
jgi:hypothetical protein